MESIAISLIIPCYNESPDVLHRAIEDLRNSLKSYCSTYEIIVVDDGSTNYEYDLKNEKDLVFIRHTQNKGYGSAIKTGIRNSKYDLIGITDADGTYPNSSYHLLLSEVSANGMVVGARDWRDISTIRKIPKKILTGFAGFLAGTTIPDLNSGMRVFRKEIAYMFWNLFPSGFSFTSTLTMACLTNEIDVSFQRIDYHKRIGKSSIHPFKDTVRFFNLILRLALYFNPKKFFMPISILLLVLAVARGLRDYLINGYLGGLALVLFFMGFQVFFFGLLAEIINKTRKFLYYGNNPRN